MNLTLGSSALVLSDGRGGYVDGMACTWHVDAPGPITAVFTSLDTELARDVVTVWADGDAAPRNYSGTALPPPFSTNATRVTIMFTSDARASGAGFELALYALVPGGTWAPTASPTASPTVAPTLYGASHTRAHTHAHTHTRTHTARTSDLCECRPGRFGHVCMRRRVAGVRRWWHARVVVRAVRRRRTGVQDGAGLGRAHRHDAVGDRRADLRLAAHAHVQILRRPLRSVLRRSGVLWVLRTGYSGYWVTVGTVGAAAT